MPEAETESQNVPNVPGVRSDVVVKYLQLLAGSLSRIVVDLNTQISNIEQNLKDAQTND